MATEIKNLLGKSALPTAETRASNFEQQGNGKTAEHKINKAEIVRLNAALVDEGKECVAGLLGRSSPGVRGAFPSRGNVLQYGVARGSFVCRRGGGGGDGVVGSGAKGVASGGDGGAGEGRARGVKIAGRHILSPIRSYFLEFQPEVNKMVLEIKEEVCREAVGLLRTVQGLPRRNFIQVLDR